MTMFTDAMEKPFHDGTMIWTYYLSCGVKRLSSSHVISVVTNQKQTALRPTAVFQKRSCHRKYHLCGVCSHHCSHGYVFCSVCNKCCHTRCEQVADDCLQAIEHLPKDYPYICRVCRYDGEGQFDYAKALLRLQWVR